MRNRKINKVKNIRDEKLKIKAPFKKIMTI